MYTEGQRPTLTTLDMNRKCYVGLRFTYCKKMKVTITNRKLKFYFLNSDKEERKRRVTTHPH